MENIEIDRKLAEAMGYEVYELGYPDVVKVYKDPPETWKRPCEDWYPTINMQDAWKVAEKFNLGCLDYHNNKWGATMLADGRFRDMPDYIVASAESAPMAISLAALKVIERSKEND